MAKILSHVWSSIRGKVGGIVYTKNQYANIVARVFVAPTNPQSYGQEVIRTCFDEASILWELLSDANRALWDDYAKTVTYQGPHGPYTITGRAIFAANYSFAKFLDINGGSAIVVGSAPPLIAGRINIGPITESPYSQAGKTGVAITVGNPSSDAMAILVQRSGAWNPTKNVYKGPWIFDHNAGFDLAAPGSTLLEMETGPGTADKIFFVRCRAVLAEAPHRISTTTIIRCTAIAVP